MERINGIRQVLHILLVLKVILSCKENHRTGELGRIKEQTLVLCHMLMNQERVDAEQKDKKRPPISSAINSPDSM